MRFGGLRSGADDQERILETSLVQNGGLLKHKDRTCGQEELLSWVVGMAGYIPCGWGKVRGRKVSMEFSYAKEGL